MILTPLQFGMSQFSTWPQSFEQDLQLYQESGIQYIEVCEGKLEIDNPHPQLQRLRETGLKVPSVQPRLHSLFPDHPRPLPESPGERMLQLRNTINFFGPYFPGTTIVTISGAAPGGNYDLAYRTAAHEYKEAARAAADQGVRLALEPLNPILMNVDTFICSLTHAARIVEAVDHPAFGCSSMCGTFGRTRLPAHRSSNLGAKSTVSMSTIGGLHVLLATDTYPANARSRS